MILPAILFALLTWAVALLLQLLKGASLTKLLLIVKIAAWLIASAGIALSILMLISFF